MYNRRVWHGLIQICGGIFLIIAASWLVTYSSDRQLEKNVRPGWHMVRAPGNLQTVALYQGSVWTGGVNGLFRFDPVTVEPLPLPQGSGYLGVVHDLLTDNQGILWVGHQQGVSRFDGMKWATYDCLPARKSNPVTALLQDKEGAIWLGLQDGVFCKGATIEQHHVLNMGPIDVLYQDNKERIWAGSSDPRRGGLACFEGGAWKSYSSNDGLLHPSVNCVTETRDGTLWIGTGFANAGGANYATSAGILAAMTRNDGLAGDKVRQIYEDRAGNLWFCSEYDGVAIFRGGKRVAVLTTADGLAGQEVKKIVQDETGIYWLATDQGLNRISAVF